MHNAWTVRFTRITDVKDRLLFVSGQGAGTGFLPFVTDRRFFLRNDTENGLVPKDEEGHAHKAGWQFHTCTSGIIVFRLDDGDKKETISLKPDDGIALVIGPGVWHSYSMSPHSSLFVESSIGYSETDYVRVYSEFQAAYGYSK